MITKIYIKKISFLFLIILALSTKAFASPLINKCVVNGQVKDSISGNGLPFATVQVFNFEDNKLFKGTLTDINGNYSIKLIPPGKYKLVASYMGYHKEEASIEIKAKTQQHSFYLTQKSFSTNEIEITAEKDLLENSLEKTTVNIAKNTTLTTGTAVDVMQTLPSVDIDIDGIINYRGSNRVIVLLNGEKSELAKSLDQIPASQIEKIELINNPSAKYEADGMSGIINIVLKSGQSTKNKTTLMLNLGYPETWGGHAGYSSITQKNSFFVNGGINHKAKFQTKEHLRENYQNPNAYNYYQYDRQDENLNNAFLNTSYEYIIKQNHKIGLSLIGTKKFNNAQRSIQYKTLNKEGGLEAESLKEIDIKLDNYTIDGNLKYRYRFKNKGQFLKANFHYSMLDQLQQMNNKYFPEPNNSQTELQNTFSEQLNKKADFLLDYAHPINDSILLETGYNHNTKNLLNNFYSDSYDEQSSQWTEDTALANRFNYIQQINALYLNMKAKWQSMEIQAGLRAEYTQNSQNNKNKHEYLDFFPSVNISRALNNQYTIFAAYNRRINRPTIKMLNPFTDEYADILNMHKGNPNLKPEYVNSYELGNRFSFNKISGFASVYFRDISQAISRVKSASNDSALYVSFINLDKAKLLGAEVSISYKPYKWWSIIAGTNVFYTSLHGSYENNQVDNSKMAWNASILNKFKLPKDFGLQFFGYYRSELPSVMGTYIARYYMDIAVNKKILKNKGQLVFKVSDVFNSYLFGLDLDALDENNYRYSQSNRRKNESRYFILSFIYNINGKEQKKKNKENFFLEGFDK